MDPTKVPALYLETLLAGLTRPGVQETWALLMHRLCGWRGFRREVVLIEEATTLDVPCLIIWGEHDMAPVEEGRDAAARIPTATTCT